MSRISETNQVEECKPAGVDAASAVAGRHLGAWFPVAAKFAVFYAVWLGLALLVRSQLASPDALQVVAIFYWFGWVFAAMTAAVLALVIAAGWLDSRAFRASESRY